MRSQRFISGCIVASIGAFFLSDPILGPITLHGGPHAYTAEAGRLQLYISAAAYGLPLIAAFIAALLIRPWPRAAAWRVLDPIAIAMAAVWMIGCVRGVVAQNEPRFILSDAFNFWIPIGVYAAMRALDDVDGIDVWLRRLILIALPAQLAFTIWAFWIQGFQSGGLSFFTLFVTWFLHEGSLIGTAASLLLIVATKKRALIVVTVLVVALFAMLARRARLLAVAVGIAALVAVVVIATPALRSRFAILPHETNNFTNLQARQDELTGIARSIRGRDWPLSLVIGQGMGATYRLDVGETGARAKVFIIPHHHDTHVSPAGWLLRTGLLGTLAYGAFFLAGAFLCIRATRDTRDAALTASYIGMLLLSLTSFTVPASPVVTVAMMLVLARQTAPR